MATNLSKFVKSKISLLNLERQAEIDQSKALKEHVSPKELQKKGVCLLKLRVRSRCTGLYGRSLVSFEWNRPGSDGKLPAHSITPGGFDYYFDIKILSFTKIVMVSRLGRPRLAVWLRCFLARGNSK